jgi:hypothetical protein
VTSHWQAVWGAADGWERTALVALLVGAVAQTTFILIYGTRKWYLVRVGRAIFFKSAALALVLDLSVVNTFVPPYGHQEQVSAVSIVAITVTILYQLVALLLSPRNPEHEEVP